MRCIDAVTRGSEPGAEVNELRPFGDRIEVTALKHIHSAAEAPDGENHETTLGSGALPDPRLVLLHPPGPSVLSNLETEGDEGSSILYQFRLGDFSLIWNDTAGPLRERGPHLFDVLSALPPTDVEVGSVLGFNDPTNGLRDIVDYVERLKPQVFYPVHHDFVTEYGASQRMKGVMEREMARRGELPTEVRWLYDPTDYLRPGLMTFDSGRHALGDAGRRTDAAQLHAHAAPRPPQPHRVREGGRPLVEARPLGAHEPDHGARFASASTVPAGERFARHTRRTARCAWSGRTRRDTAAAASARAHRSPSSSAATAARARWAAACVARARGSHIVFGTRRGHVRFVAIADSELLSRPRALRRYLKFAR